MIQELTRALGVGGVFLLIFGVAEVSRRWAPPPEWTRKFVHVAGGLVAATLPWVLESHWTVLGLGVALGGLLWGTRRMGWLQSVHGIRRETEGGLYFPLAIYLLFLLAADQPVFYLTAVLVLVVADTAAAILGSSYGRTTYEVEEDRRSVEGSTAFFLMAFLSVHLPLLLLTDLDRGAVVLISLQLALLVTFFEAISLKGMDNLVVPLGTLYLLVKLTPQDAVVIAGQLVAQLGIIAVIGVVAWRYRFLTMSGALALMLFFYGAWSLGGPEWVLAPTLAMLGFVGFRGWLQEAAEAPDSRYQVLALFYVAIVAAVLFVANNTFETLVSLPPGWEGLAVGDPFYPLYVGAVAAHLGILSWVLLDGSSFQGARRRLVVGAAFVGAYLLVVPLGVLAPDLLDGALSGASPAEEGLWRPAGEGTGSGSNMLLAALMLPLSALLFAGLRRMRAEPLTGLSVLHAQTVSVAVATLAALPLQLRWVGVL